MHFSWLQCKEKIIKKREFLMDEKLHYTKIASDRIKNVSLKLLCQEDFLDGFDNIIDGNRDFKLAQFKTWLEALSIDFTDEDLSSKEKLRGLIKKIPETREEIAAAVLNHLKGLFYEKSEVFPNAAAYMQRLVQNLGDPDLTSKGSVRAQILKHFLRYSDSDIKPICDFVLDRYKIPKGEDKIEFVIKHIDDDNEAESVFSLLNTQNMDAYRKLKSLISSLSTNKEYSADEKWKCLEKKISWDTALYEKYKKCEESSAHTDMREAMIHLEQNIREKYADVRQHVKYSDLPVDTMIFLEDLIRYTEDVFKGVTKAKVKKDRSLGALYEGKLLYNIRNSDRKTTPNPILLLADDLANGRFRMFGVTREYLYKFAIVFGMTAAMPGQTANEERDIEKNLLFDYYSSNNLFFSESKEDCQDKKDDSNKNKSKKSDVSEASGEGINWKNFVEVVYLYYICCDGLTRKERLSKAEKAISSLKKKNTQRNNHFNTQYFRNDIISKEKLFSLPESELESFIEAHYDLHKYDVKKDTSYIKYSSEQVSAKNVAAKLRNNISKYQCYDVTSLKTKNQTIQSLAQQLDNNGYSKDFVDSWEEYILSMFPDKKPTDFLNDDEKHQVLVSMAESKPFDDIRSFIMAEKDESFSKSMLQALKFTESVIEDDNEVPSRNQILALYAYEFYYKYASIASDCEIMDFEQMKFEFEYGVNMYLEQCRYQKLSEKNFYDVFLLFVLYYISVL